MSFLPQTAESPSEPIKRYQCLLAPLSGSMTLEEESGLDEVPVDRIEQMKQKSIDQHDNPKQFEEIFKAPDAGTLQGQFASCGLKRSSKIRDDS